MTGLKIRAVIFDMDGVLVDSNEAHFRAFQEMGRRVGVPFTRETLVRCFGMHNNEIFPLWLGPGLSQARIAELALEKEALYREMAAGALKQVPGAVELARELKSSGFPLAVGSSGPRANVELAVRTLGLGDCFDVLITGDDVLRGKPAPDIFLKASDQLGIPPGECLVIEDAVQGVAAALAAGMRVVAVTTSNPRAALHHATRVIDALAELNSEVVRSFS